MLADQTKHTFRASLLLKKVLFVSTYLALGVSVFFSANYLNKNLFQTISISNKFVTLNATFKKIDVKSKKFTQAVNTKKLNLLSQQQIESEIKIISKLTSPKIVTSYSDLKIDLAVTETIEGLEQEYFQLRNKFNLAVNTQSNKNESIQIASTLIEYEVVSPVAEKHTQVALKSADEKKKPSIKKILESKSSVVEPIKVVITMEKSDQPAKVAPMFKLAMNSVAEASTQLEKSKTQSDVSFALIEKKVSQSILPIEEAIKIQDEQEAAIVKEDTINLTQAEVERDPESVALSNTIKEDTNHDLNPSKEEAPEQVLLSVNTQKPVSVQTFTPVPVILNTQQSEVKPVSTQNKNNPKGSVQAQRQQEEESERKAAFFDDTNQACGPSSHSVFRNKGDYIEAFDWDENLSNVEETVLSHEGSVNSKINWVKASLPGYESIIYLKSKTKKSSVPLFSNNTTLFLNSFLKSHQRNDLGALFLRLPENWDAELLDTRHEPAVYFNDLGDKINNSFDKSRLALFRNVEQGLQLLYFTNQKCKISGAIPVLINEEGISFVDVADDVSVQDFSGSILDGSSAKVSGIAGVHLSVLGQSTSAFSKANGKIRLNKLVTFGDYPVILRTNSKKHFTHQYTINVEQLSNFHLFLFSDQYYQQWRDQLYGDIGQNTAMIMAAFPGLFIEENGESLQPDISNFGPISLTPEIYTVSNQGDLIPRGQIEENRMRLFGVQFSEGTYELELKNKNGSTVYSKVFKLKPNVVQVIY